MIPFSRFACVILGFAIWATISVIFGDTAGDAVDDLVAMSFGALAMFIAGRV